MKKQIKTKMLSLALIAGVAATAGALALNHSANQAAAEENAAVFQMENSVRLRLNGNGLAFSVKMDGTKYNEITNDKNKSLYFIVMPSMYLGNVKTADGYDYAKAIVRDGNGDYNYETSHCLYVNASEAIYQSGEDYYALGGVSDVLEANRKLDYVAIACVETKSESGFTYEYAALPEGKTQMPTVSQYTTLSKSVLYATTDYSAQIAQYYSWFGKGEYALTIATTEDYNALVGKINGGADLADMELRINSGVDKTQATLNEGMTLPAKQVTYSTVKFYDDDGKTLLSSADVNKDESVTPITPTKAATEEYTYTFEKWVTEKGGDVAASFENITANMSVYAKWAETKNKYSVKWVVDGIAVKEEQVEYGVVPSFGSTDPVKAADEKATYTFAGWDSEVVAVKKDVTYTAVFTKNVKPYYAFIDMSAPADLDLFSGEKYNSTDKYADTYTSDYVLNKTHNNDEIIGDYLETTVNHSGAMLRINYQTGLEDGRAYFNEKLSDHNKVVFYINSPVSNVTLRLMRGDWGIVKAKQVLSSGWNAIVIEKQDFVDASGTYMDGESQCGLYLMIQDDGALNNKTLKISSFYAYTEAGYENRNYNVTFKNGDEVLQEGKVFYGLTPIYNGDTPVKVADGYTYAFNGWDKEISPVTGDVEYIARFIRLFGVTKYYTALDSKKIIFDTNLTIAQSGLKEGNTITGFVTASNGTNEGGLSLYYKTATTFTVYNHGGTFAIGFDAENLPASAIVTFTKGTIFNINGVEYALDQTYVFYSNAYTNKDNFSEYTLSRFVAGNAFLSSIPKDERGGGSYYTQVQLTSGGVTSTEWIYLQFDNYGEQMVVNVKRNEDATCGWKTGDVVYIKKGTVASYWSNVAISAEDYTLTKTADGWVLATGAPTI